MLLNDEIWRCPLCMDVLYNVKKKLLSCKKCYCKFPVILGIPDFRTNQIKSKEQEEEESRVKVLSNRFHSCSFHELVKLHSSMIKKRPGILGDLDKKIRLSAGKRGKDKYSFLSSFLSSNKTGNALEGSILEIGCGVGDMLPYFSKKGAFVAALDISMDLLIIAKKLIVEQGLTNVWLACCEAERLPIIPDSMNLIYASHVIEHLRNQKRSIEEIHRTLKTDGIFYFDSPNRFSITYEPHVQLLFVGYLPRFLMNAYSLKFRGIPYNDKHLLSYFELHRLLRSQPWKFDIFSQKIKTRPKKIRSTKNHLYRILTIFTPAIIQKYLFAESFLVLARKN